MNRNMNMDMDVDLGSDMDEAMLSVDFEDIEPIKRVLAFKVKF
jgi:hypothetical protein